MTQTDMESLVSSVSSMPSSSYSPTSCSKSYTSTHKSLPLKSSSLWGAARHGLGSQALLQRKEVRGERCHHHVGVARAYMERSSNPVADFFNRIQGSLPIVGLLSRIMSDEGGIGTDRIQLVEFCRKVERSCSQEASRAFYELSERHGQVNVSFVLFLGVYVTWIEQTLLTLLHSLSRSTTVVCCGRCN